MLNYNAITTTTGKIDSEYLIIRINEQKQSQLQLYPENQFSLISCSTLVHPRGGLLHPSRIVKKCKSTW